MKYIITFVLAFAVQLEAKIIEKILASVNGEIITQTDLRSFQRKVKQDQLLDDLFNVDYKKIAKNKSSSLGFLIDEKIVDSEVKRLGLEASSDRIDNEIQNIIRQNGIDKKALVKDLKSKGIVFSEYQDFLKKRLERQSLIQKEITSQIKISEDDLKSYYLRNSNNAQNNSYEYRLSNILLFIKGNKDEALKKAKSIYRELQQGGNFSNLAAKHSQDPNFSEGGFLGEFKSGDFIPALEKEVSKLNPGQIAKPVIVGDKIFIAKVDQKKLIDNPDYIQQRPRIMAVLQEEAFKKQFRFWLDQKREVSDIRRN
ncbi:MAG: peptidylprolyl isomerase [Bdellovibrionales bacterium]